MKGLKIRLQGDRFDGLSMRKMGDKLAFRGTPTFSSSCEQSEYGGSKFNCLP